MSRRKRNAVEALDRRMAESATQGKDTCATSPTFLELSEPPAPDRSL
jgi:hypothetical protein